MANWGNYLKTSAIILSTGVMVTPIEVGSQSGTKSGSDIYSTSRLGLYGPALAATMDVKTSSEEPPRKIAMHYLNEINRPFGKSNNTVENDYFAGCIKGDGNYYVCKSCRTTFSANIDGALNTATVKATGTYYSVRIRKSRETKSGWKKISYSQNLEEEFVYYDSYQESKRYCRMFERSNYEGQCIVGKNSLKIMIGTINKYGVRDLVQNQYKGMIDNANNWCANKIVEFY